MSRTLPIPRIGSLNVPGGALSNGHVVSDTTSTRINVRPSVEDAFFGRGDIVFQREGADLDFELAPFDEEDLKDTQLVRIPPWDLPEGLSVTDLDVEFAFLSDEFANLDKLAAATTYDTRWEAANDVISLFAIVVGVPVLWMTLLIMVG